MKRTLTTLLLVFGIFTALSAQQAAAPPTDVKGDWDMSIDTPMGSMPVGLSITAQEAEKFSGTLSSPQGDLAIAGTAAGTDVAFSGMFDAGGQAITLTFTGTIEDNAMGGDANFGGMGSGTWSAKKK